MQDLRHRTREFALRVIRLYRSLPKSGDAQILGKQVLRSATSIGAQYREACRAKSTPDFVSKCQGVLQELDETAYWFELLVASGLVSAGKMRLLTAEVEELTAMFTAMTKNAKRKTRA